MKTKIVTMFLATLAAAMMLAGCGKNDAAPKAESEAVTENADTAEAEPAAENADTVEAEAVSEKADTAEEAAEEEATEEAVCEHEWVDADFWNAKTCSICGETDGEPVKAMRADEPFAEADVETDMTMIITDNNGNTLGTNTAKVWFTNYKIFDSDDTHDAKDGYEWRSAEMHIAIGDDTEFERFNYDVAELCGADYYEDSDYKDDGTEIIIFNGEEYSIAEPNINELEVKRNTSIPEFADKYGWSGEGASYYVMQYEYQVPKGFDGCYIGWADYNDFIAKGEDFDAIENAVYFRMK